MIEWPRKSFMKKFPWISPSVKGAARLWALSKSNLEPRMLIADLGCGARHWLDGTLLDMPKNLRVYMVDRRLFPKCTPKGFQKVRSDLTEKVDLPSNSVNRVFCISVMEHLTVEGRDTCLSEIERILVPGGQAFLSIAYFFQWSKRVQKLCTESINLRRQGSNVPANLDLRRMFKRTKLRLINPEHLSEFPGYSRFERDGVLKDPDILKGSVHAEKEITAMKLMYSEVLIGLKKGAT